MRRRTIIIVIGILLLGGAVRLPFELSLSKEMQEQRLLQPPLDLSLRDQLTQAGAFAVLGGFRSLLATIYDLRVYVAFEQQPHSDWHALESHYKVIHAVQPFQEQYWSFAGWHLAYNAASDYKGRNELRDAIRMKRSRDYVERGVAIFNKGVEILPDSARLHQDLAAIHSGQSKHSRDPNPRQAAHHYKRVFEVTGRSLFERLGAYELVLFDKDRDAWIEAREILTRHYLRGRGDRTPSVVTNLDIVEERLGIPRALRTVSPVRSLFPDEE